MSGAVSPVARRDGAPFSAADLAELQHWERTAARAGLVVLHDWDEETDVESPITIRSHDGVPYVAIGRTTPAAAADSACDSADDAELAYHVIPLADGSWGVFDCCTGDSGAFATMHDALAAILTGEPGQDEPERRSGQLHVVRG